jgi:hypothetical protein
MRLDPGVLIGFILTLFIYSYLVKDNPLYRLAIHLLVGVSAAYAAVIIFRQAMFPVFEQVRQDPVSPDSLLWLLPILLGLSLVLRWGPESSWLSSGTLALMVGVGAAVALIGAISGTLWPLVSASDSQDPIRGLVVAMLTICTLFTFQFTGRLGKQQEWVRPIWQRGLSFIGQSVLMITFGALFTAVFSTSLILLVDRVGYYMNQISQWLP